MMVGTVDSTVAPHSILRKSIDVDPKSPPEDVQIMPWGTPSHTGWGFSPPKASSSMSTPPSFGLMASTPVSETLPTLTETPMTESLLSSRPPLSNRHHSDLVQQQFQKRHARSSSMNFDDRYRRVALDEDVLGGFGDGYNSNGSWSRSPLMGPRFVSGTSSPLVPTSPNGSNSSELPPTGYTRRTSHQLQQPPPMPHPISQRHSISSGQSPMYMQNAHNSQQHLHRISLEQGRETMGRSTIVPLQSPSLTPQKLVVKPQIMLPPPKTPPMSGQNTSSTSSSCARARPMSMIVVGALASSGYSSSYTGPGGAGSPGGHRSRMTFGGSSNNSSPATSPRLGPGMTSRSNSGSRSNSLMSAPFPMMRANSMTTVILSGSGGQGTAGATRSGTTSRGASGSSRSERSEPASPVLESSWGTRSLTALPSQASLFSSSPSQINGSPTLTAISVSASVLATALATPPTSEASNKESATRLGMHSPGRIRTSPSSTTTSSISTPTTPSTFSPSSSSALLESLNTSAQLASPPPSVSGSGNHSRRKSTHLANSETAAPSSPSSSTSSSAAGSVRSTTQSSVGRKSTIRLSLPKLALSPSAPSTAFCKTTVTAEAAGNHATTTTTTTNATATVTSQGEDDPTEEMKEEVDLGQAPLGFSFASSKAKRPTTAEVPAIANLTRASGAHVRARSPAISMANVPFVFNDLGKEAKSGSVPSTPKSESKESSPTLSPVASCSQSASEVVVNSIADLQEVADDHSTTDTTLVVFEDVAPPPPSSRRVRGSPPFQGSKFPQYRSSYSNHNSKIFLPVGDHPPHARILLVHLPRWPP